MSKSENEKGRLYEIVALCKSYCELCQGYNEFEKDEFIDRILNLLPRIYFNFFDLVPEHLMLEESYFSTYVDEDLYNYVQGGIATLMGENDVYLDTFHEDMKYSDVPISASISEGLADIFQPLYDFISIVRDTEGESILEAYIDCREKFESYWSQNLCNVMKALNDIKFG